MTGIDNWEYAKDKICASCSLKKQVVDFPKRTSSPDGIHYLCFDCKRKREKEWYYANRGKAVAKSVRWAKDNKKKHAARQKRYDDAHTEEKRERARIYYVKNKEEINRKTSEYRRKREKDDPVFKVRLRLSSRIHRAIKRGSKSSNTMSLLGCSLEELKGHLESKFQCGMTWGNYGYYGWHVDHVVPCAFFDLSDPKQQQECFHFSNLQPLWRVENMRKSSSLKDKETEDASKQY